MVPSTPEEGYSIVTQPGAAADAHTDTDDMTLERKYAWHFPMCCSVFTHCAYDTPLCCYALTCPICLYSEIRGKLDGRHCYNHCCLAVAQGGCIDVPLQTGAVCVVYLGAFWMIPFVSVPSVPVELTPCCHPHLTHQSVGLMLNVFGLAIGQVVNFMPWATSRSRQLLADQYFGLTTVGPFKRARNTRAPTHGPNRTSTTATVRRPPLPPLPPTSTDPRHPPSHFSDCGNPCLAHTFCASCALYQEAVFVKQKYGDFECCCYKNIYEPYFHIPDELRPALAHGETERTSVVQHPEHVLRSMRELDQPHKEQPVPSEPVEFKHSVREAILMRSPVSGAANAGPFSQGGEGGAALTR